MINVGILGGGNISETHARAAHETDGAEVVAIYGQNLGKTANLAERYGAKAYATLAEFLDHSPLEVVLIGSPSGLHAEQGIAAAKRGLHVLVEKPVDITTERIDALVNQCNEAGVKLGVFFQDRVAPDIQRLKDLLLAGTLGKPILISARVKWYRPTEYYSGSRWRGTSALDGGGALMNQGVHTIDLLLWLMGEVTRVSARTATALHEIEVEDTVVATLEFANGAIGTLEAATSVYPGYPRSLELTGTEGTIVLEHDRIVAADLRNAHVDLAPGSEGANPSATSPVMSDVSGHKKLLQDFLRAIETNGRPICDGVEGRRSVALVQAIYESARTGQALTL
ncbi:MAG TPA: Gfo/Idh/MocA family oxidoreductase [Pyrinomonadaceae bacterium]|jgi:predicted dehydrogenase|nr:Gfo/Idh/MocA family oxidoreductase [Pyrinomonadaceae bacterium]